MAGLWPILHIGSFMAITGPKRDQWLVKTVGTVIAGVGATVAVLSIRRRPPPETGMLLAFVGLGLAAVEVVYVAKRVISPIYLLDAIAEVIGLLLLAANWREDEGAEEYNPAHAS